MSLFENLLIHPKSDLFDFVHDLNVVYPRSKIDLPRRGVFPGNLREIPNSFSIFGVFSQVYCWTNHVSDFRGRTPSGKILLCVVTVDTFFFLKT